MGAVRGFLMGLAFLAAAMPAAWPVPVMAQSLGRVVSPVLTVDRDRLYTGSTFGKRVNQELEAASTAMAQETRKIEAALEEEEKALTIQRESLDPQAFRDLANAFDEKVQALRDERETAEANLRKQIEDAQLEFFDRIGPVLGQLVRERGAVLVLDRRAILLAAADVDITDEAITRIDAVLGDGAADAPPDDEPAAPAPTQETGPVDTIPAPAADPATDDAAPDAQ